MKLLHLVIVIITEMTTLKTNLLFCMLCYKSLQYMKRVSRNYIIKKYHFYILICVF